MAPSRAAAERKIALCVSSWSADSTLYAWTFAKNYFLRKQRDANGTQVLSPLDRLFIVHVWREGKHRERERWSTGGPLLRGLDVALANYRHTVVELEPMNGNVHSALLDFAVREDVDILILGSRESKGAVHKLVQPGSMGSTSDSVKARCKCPCLIVRPATARNEKMRIRSNVNLGALLEAQGGYHAAFDAAFSARAAAAAAPQADDMRKVVLAFEGLDVGRRMLAWAAQYVLFPDDEVFVVHCNKVARAGVKGARKAAAAASAAAVTGAEAEEDDVDEEVLAAVAEELPKIHVALCIQLKEDVKAGLCELAEAHGADLLVVGHAHSSRLRKTFTTSTASHLAHHAPCPTLIIPYKHLGLEPAQSEVLPGEEAAAAAAAVAGEKGGAVGGRRGSVGRLDADQGGQCASSGALEWLAEISPRGLRPAPNTAPPAAAAGPSQASTPTAALTPSLGSGRGGSGGGRGMERSVFAAAPAGNGAAHVQVDGASGGAASRLMASPPGAWQAPPEAPLAAELQRQLHERTCENAALKEQVRVLQTQLQALSASAAPGPPIPVSPACHAAAAPTV
ncbi:hypothetical protein WJX81_000319 [Elliptochloris bilobata]|uniref:UspA domain-containing protein n=1 Tax=Elliptochloris bilobata TaxID=381761 RepID=A0AAW1RGD4_9CHLO